MLDRGANGGIFNNAQLLTNLHKTDCSATISGSGGKLTTNTVGEHGEGASIIYLNNQDQYTVQHEGCDTLLFERVGEGCIVLTPRTPRLFIPSDEAIPRLSSINNIPVTRQDIMRSVDIFGRDGHIPN
eukprot:gene33830-43712_t